ncbi:MAG: GNAT family N-acetyltransferase [Desulfobacterales bacterium]|jgi:ribosomal protein S18 acetylase RimI-like enzyme
MEKLKISFLEKSDLPEASNVLSKAMLKVPLHTAVFQGHGEKERKIIEITFFKLLSDLPGIAFLARINSQIVGVMRMKSCDGSKVSKQDSQTEDEDNLEWRKSIWRNEWARHDPMNQHWHLGPVGVLPSHQGKGIGTNLLSRFCQEVDACLSPAYLETDSDKNVQFYERFGFEVVKETEIFNVKNRYMWRPQYRKFAY